MKKFRLFITLLFQLTALPLLIVGGVFFALSRTTSNVYLYLFGQVGFVPIAMCLAFGLTLEGLYFIIMALLKKKITYVIPTGLLIPVVITLVFLGMLDFSESYEIKVDSFNETLIVERESFVYESNAYLYEKTSLLTVSKIETNFPDDIDAALQTRRTVVEYYPNGIAIVYRTSDKEDAVYFKYENNTFVRVNSLEEIK